MDKDEILKKSRREYGITDEREQQEQVFAASVGMWTMYAVVLILCLVKGLVFHQPWIDLISIVFFGCAAVRFAQYYKSRNRQVLISGILFAVGAVSFSVGYIGQQVAGL